jgi:phage shock protein B
MEGIEFFFIIIGLPVICGTVIVLAAMFMFSRRRKPSELASREDTKLMQEMHQALLRMEKRIDALETIYFEMDRQSKGVK